MGVGGGGLGTPPTPPAHNTLGRASRVPPSLYWSDRYLSYRSQSPGKLVWQSLSSFLQLFTPLHLVRTTLDTRDSPILVVIPILDHSLSRSSSSFYLSICLSFPVSYFYYLLSLLSSTGSPYPITPLGDPTPLLLPTIGEVVNQVRRLSRLVGSRRPPVSMDFSWPSLSHQIIMRRPPHPPPRGRLLCIAFQIHITLFPQDN